ncbi:hypothetical protein DFH08DRAFT_799263 [Mycena albidolilacea]|uniref:Uncharacterized protein n=1 Tax=Mycena albidolilacea TaxID=1033008 RepID=A0AAD7AQ70_9AGAR|nr:hypothetical protein DFH08DRAFT_799263 [Mycena albidolilacea]
MAFTLHNFALLWNLGLRFFLNPTTSPHYLLDWNHQNTNGTPLLLGYGVENFHCPRQLFHERSDRVSLMLVFGYSGVDSGVLGPKPVCQVDRFLCLWLAMFTASVSWASFQVFLDSALPHVHYYPSPWLPVFDFRPQIADYPQVWSLDEITHQHFLVCTWLSFCLAKTTSTKLVVDNSSSDLCPLQIHWFPQCMVWPCDFSLTGSSNTSMSLLLRTDSGLLLKKPPLQGASCDFIGATLPMPPPPPSPTLAPSPPAAHSPSLPPITVLEAGEPSPVPTPSSPPVPSGRKQARTCREKQARSPAEAENSQAQPEGWKLPTTGIPSARACSNMGWTRFSNAYKEGKDKVLHRFRVLLWEHLGRGSYSPMHPDPWWLDLTQTRAYLFCFPGPAIVVLLGSKVESSEGETPAPKKRKMLHSQNTRSTTHPKVVEVMDEDDNPTIVNDTQNHDLKGEDVQMLSPESSIVADDHNYDPGLEPVPAIVPPE